MASTIFNICALNGLATPSFSVFTNDGGHEPISFISFPRLSMPHIACKSSRLRMLQRKRVPIVSCLEGDNSGICPESGKFSFSSDSPKEVTIDIKLPRRSLLVKFTCNACGERSEKLINRLAYERGTVFVQCSGCLQHHKLVDNLGLVVEYDFREELDVDSNANEH